MEALNDLVRSGKVRYIGASSMMAWEFQKANRIAEKNGWSKFVSMQNFYNLLYREEEHEMVPYCFDEGIGSIPWSPLARGLLTGKNRKTTRMETDSRINFLFSREIENNDLIIDRVVEVADKLGHSPAQISLAWMFSKKHITSAIVGIGSEEHLHDTIGSLGIMLSEKDIEYLEEAYQPHVRIA
jgi:aryl-alcohol dehydrogenase-like predicted oxidoreductase